MSHRMLTVTRALRLLPLRLALVIGTVGLFVMSGGADTSVAGGTTFTVTNTDDPGNGFCDQQCTFREAIDAANSGAGNSIHFNIGTGTPSINIVSPLPTITASMDILGNTGGAVRVEIRGPGGSSSFAGLTIAASAPGTLISHLVINNFANGDGIQVDAANVTLHGNFIGTNAGGLARANPDGTFQTGVNVYGTGVHIGGTSGTTPGGSCTGDCNLISGNLSGIYIRDSAANAVIQGNFVGTDVTGTAAVQNNGGMEIRGSGALVGGPGAGQGNLLSGNTYQGISITAAPTVQGNLIGTDTTGMNPLPNGRDGIFIDTGNNSVVGGVSAGARNVISGNSENGIFSYGSENLQVLGNFIGTAADGVTPLGNGFAGVQLFSASSNNIIGGAADNTIAFNGGDGVLVDGDFGGNGNQIRGNSTHDNVGKGIALINGGNNGIASPVINPVGAQFAGNGVSGTACPNCTIDIYSDDLDEGRIYEGSTTADGSGNWTFSGSVTGPNVTATATDADDNTSEFSEPFTVPAPTPTPTHSPTPTPTLSPTPTPTGTPGPALIQGDVDCDGDVDTDDFTFLLQYFAGLNDGTQPDPCPNLGEAVPASVASVASLWGDVDCVNGLNPLDALYVLAHTVDIELPHPGCPAIGDPLT